MAIVFFSGLWLSSLLVGREEEKVGRVASLVRLVQETKNAVENYSMPASQILLAAWPELIRSCGYKGEAIPKSFLEMSENLDSGDLESNGVFFEFARDFGKNYRGSQTQSCEACAMRLKARYVELSGELAMKRRLIRCVCLSLSLFAIILLL